MTSYSEMPRGVIRVLTEMSGRTLERDRTQKK